MSLEVSGTLRHKTMDHGLISVLLTELEMRETLSDDLVLIPNE